MTYVVVETPTYRQYSDGTEEVSFSEEEWAIMATDPAFGYVCGRGHAFDFATREARAKGYDVPCGACEREAEDAYYAEMDVTQGEGPA